VNIFSPFEPVSFILLRSVPVSASTVQLCAYFHEISVFRLAYLLTPW